MVTARDMALISTKQQSVNLDEDHNVKWSDNSLAEEFWEDVKRLVENDGEFDDFSEVLDEALEGGNHSGFFEELACFFNASGMDEVAKENFDDRVRAEARDKLDFFVKELEEEFDGAVSDQVFERTEQLEKEFDQRIKDAQELKAVYELVEKRFLDNPGFRTQALKGLRDDLSLNIRDCNVPSFYQELLGKCNAVEIVGALADEFFDELLEVYGDEVKSAVRQKYEEKIAGELVNELRNDKGFVEKVKADFAKEVASQLFS